MGVVNALVLVSKVGAMIEVVGYVCGGVDIGAITEVRGSTCVGEGVDSMMEVGVDTCNLVLPSTIVGVEKLSVNWITSLVLI